MGFPMLFFLVLICFQTLSSHPRIGVSEENEDINDGKALTADNVKVVVITVTILVAKQ